MNRRKRLIGTAVTGGIVILVAVLAVRLSPLWPGPALPAGATRLAIATEAPHLMPAFGCPVALVAPARVVTSDDELVLRSVATGELVRVVWPSGWAAWRDAGRAVLVARDGSVVAREGDVLDDLGGGVGTDDLFHICVIGA